MYMNGRGYSRVPPTAQFALHLMRIAAHQRSKQEARFTKKFVLLFIFQRIMTFFIVYFYYNLTTKNKD